MGRAFPTLQQTTPVVLGGGHAHSLPNVIADGNGNVVVMTRATSERMVGRAFRAILAEMGSSVGFATGAYSGANVKSWAVKNTVSLAWRIGRAVALCRARNDLDAVADIIVDAVGGPTTAHVLFRYYASLLLCVRDTNQTFQWQDRQRRAQEFEGPPRRRSRRRGRLAIPFMNENLIAMRVEPRRYRASSCYCS